jgi:ubiquinone/menaquinone biosynthesis C-methylase UbiE
VIGFTPFDVLASNYDRLWSNSQRSKVWREIDSLFHSGDRILDLGCGTGVDALHFAERGVDVFGIDASSQMIEIAASRGARVQRLSIEELAELDGRFHGAISNFGVLNCAQDLRPVAVQLARLVGAGGAVAICLMGRFAWGETLTCAGKLDWRRAVRRWSGRAAWRGMEVFYHSSRQVRAAFAHEFSFKRRVSIGRGDHQLYLFQRRSVC